MILIYIWCATWHTKYICYKRKPAVIKGNRKLFLSSSKKRRQIPIFDSIKHTVNAGIDSLTEFLVLRNARSNIKSNVKTNSQPKNIIPQNKFAIKFANLFELSGIVRKENFYKCDYDLLEIQSAIGTD